MVYGRLVWFMEDKDETIGTTTTINYSTTQLFNYFTDN